MSSKAPQHRVVWFEIATADLTRAMTFYSTVLETDFHVETMNGTQMAVFAHEQDAVAGCLIHAPHMKPSAEGTVVYLNAGDDLSQALNRVTPAGGAVLVPKTQISPEIGFFAVFKDTEGNSVGLFSPH